MDGESACSRRVTPFFASRKIGTSRAGHLRATAYDLQALASSFHFELPERTLGALRRRVQAGAGHLDVRVTEGRLVRATFHQLFERRLGMGSSTALPNTRGKSINSRIFDVFKHIIN